ncbi:glycine C-acetyltransferase [Clostridiaceae bacterium M8S5]|nr:glycine C-acetyltransferase [Clostridiaceae bacterium M8S5]
MKVKESVKYYKSIVEDSKNTWKRPMEVISKQDAHVDTLHHKGLLNMCANNYLGLAGSAAMADAAKKGIDRWGFGLSAGRSLCGTQSVHRELERRLSNFLHMEDTLLYTSCFDANGGIFAALLDSQDAVISDELNHASIIDGIRLCKAQRYIYKNNNMSDLRKRLEEAKDALVKLIVTDGVFSMEGTIASLVEICDLAEEYGALVMVDDSHATGFVGAHGRGTHEHCGVEGRVDIISGTLGKALGGASGGFISASKYIVTVLRQRSRPYVFSNSLMPCICQANVKVIDILEESTGLRDKLMDNTQYYREEIKKLGFEVPDGAHPIVPIILGDESVAAEFSQRMIDKGVFVMSISYPVVAKGRARLRTQISAAHSKEDLDFVISCFAKVKEEMGL